MTSKNFTTVEKNFPWVLSEEFKIKSIKNVFTHKRRMMFCKTLSRDWIYVYLFNTEIITMRNFFIVVFTKVFLLLFIIIKK